MNITDQLKFAEILATYDFTNLAEIGECLDELEAYFNIARKVVPN